VTGVIQSDSCTVSKQMSEDGLSMERTLKECLLNVPPARALMYVCMMEN